MAIRASESCAFDRVLTKAARSLLDVDSVVDRSRKIGDALADFIAKQWRVDAIGHANIFMHQVHADGLVVGHRLRMLQGIHGMTVAELVRRLLVKFGQSKQPTNALAQQDIPTLTDLVRREGAFTPPTEKRRIPGRGRWQTGSHHVHPIFRQRPADREYRVGKSSPICGSSSPRPATATA